MALANSSLLRPQSVLQQLLEEINFQRAKEMRQMLKDDGGFVMLQGTTYWTDLFVRHFLFQIETQETIDSDDLLFFVRKKHIKSTSRHMPKFETDVDVYRKDSRKLPIGDPDVDWEETVYLNLIIHQFNYTLTLAICTRTSPKELQVLRRHSQRVYASPSRRKMDKKGDGEEMTYPHICFMVDNFDEVFCDIMVRDGEMVCVELVANDRDGTVQGVIFLGSIRYDALKKVYDARQSSISTKLAQRMTFGLFSGAGPQTRCEFVRMKGPQGKGHAEMAVTKPKGSGVETPTSEPGFCMTDMHDEWDEDADDFLNYRHQRRLSDPSANLNNYSRYGWKTKPSAATNDQSSKAMSQNEGLDNLADEVSEIEAGDLKDDERFASPSNKINVNSNCLHNASLDTAAVPPTEMFTIETATCCNCFGPLKSRWDNDAISNQMSEVYCRACENDEDEDAEIVRIPKNCYDSPAILSNVTRKTVHLQRKIVQSTNIHSILNIESELELPNVLAEDVKCNRNNCDDFEFGDDVVVASDKIFDNTTQSKMSILKQINTKEMIRVRGKEELPFSCQIAEMPNDPCNNECQQIESKTNVKIFSKQIPNKVNCTDNHPLIRNDTVNSAAQANQSNYTCDNNFDNNKQSSRMSIFKHMHRNYSTLPKIKKRTTLQHTLNNIVNHPPLSIPTRITPDGTTIYYFCDLAKTITKELDDGAYNPLWTSKGFTQTFHFWKEHRRQQSVPLNAFLTYITLPWWSIAKDLLDHRENPILTF